MAVRGSAGSPVCVVLTVSVLALEGQRAVPRATLGSGYAFVHPELGPALRDLYGAG